MRDVSSGGVVARWAENELQVVLVGRGDRWNLPKGTPEIGESLAQTALREVREETGLHVRILAPLSEIHYQFGVRGTQHQKTVHFFLMESTGGSTENHDWEHDSVEWLSADEAVRRASFPNEAAVIEQARGQVAALQDTESGPGASDQAERA